MRDDRLTMTVSWAWGGAGHYTATMSPPGLSHRRLHAESLDACIDGQLEYSTTVQVRGSLPLISGLHRTVGWRANAAFGADSLSDTAPLRELIAKYITAETLKRIAAAYYDNRHLVIGTTNID